MAVAVAVALVPAQAAGKIPAQAKACPQAQAQLLSPVLAVAGAKLSRRVLLIVLMLAFGLFNTLSALAPDFRMMLLARFLSGLPHGAYFGVAALVAASVVPRSARARVLRSVPRSVVSARCPAL